MRFLQPHQSPWPAWHGHETVPITDKDGFSAPWNVPTSGVLAAGATKSYTIRFTLATGGPRTRNDALAKIGKPVLNAVPGFVISPEMTGAALYVTPPKGTTLQSVGVSDPVMTVSTPKPHGTNGMVVVNVTGVSRGRCRLSLRFSDGSVDHVHYSVLPPFTTQASLAGKSWAEDAWLPRDYPDPFGRSVATTPRCVQ